jgi:hypothetical protein
MAAPMNRRGFLAVLAGAPIAAKMVPASPDLSPVPAHLSRESDGQRYIRWDGSCYRWNHWTQAWDKLESERYARLEPRD